MAATTRARLSDNRFDKAINLTVNREMRTTTHDCSASGPYISITVAVNPAAVVATVNCNVLFYLCYIYI